MLDSSRRLGRVVVAHGDISYPHPFRSPTTGRTKAFYEHVLGLKFTPGGLPRGGSEPIRTSREGMHGDAGQPGGATLCYRVADMAAAVERVRSGGRRG